MFCVILEKSIKFKELLKSVENTTENKRIIKEKIEQWIKKLKKTLKC